MRPYPIHNTNSHFLYRFLEGKKTTRSQFSMPGLREIYRNPGFIHEKVQKGDFLNKDSRELFFFLVLGSYEAPEGLGR